MGDAAATAHFSVGSGTKLALESAIALAEYLHTEPTMADAFRRYEDERRTEVLRLQSAARNSTEWFEEVERYLHLDPVQFNYSLLTRSQRISHENLRTRDKAWLESAEMWFEQQATGDKPNAARPPMFAPFRLRDLHLKNRVVVSPMAQYRAVDGTPTDWHLVHYAERAKGGAGLVYTEMTCVSPEGRITPGCTGLYAPEHEAAWKRIVDFIHAETDAKIAIQLGHSGPKGSTQLGWETMDAPLPSGNWEVMAPSPVAWSPANQVPREMTRADMDKVRGQFVRAAEMAERAGFDMLELHYAHGYLMSAFITPLTNRRTDAYGGSPREPHALPARGVPRRARGVAGGQADLGAHLRQRLGGRGRRDAGGRRRHRAHAQGGRRRHHRRVGRPDLAGARPGLRPHVPDAVLRPHPQRDRHRHHGGRQHLRARPRQLDPDGGARRPRAAWRGRISPIPTGRCMPPRSSATRVRPGRSPIWPAATSCTGWRSAPKPKRRGCDGALDGRHALITGGGTGIGAAVAETLAAAGAAVSIVGRRAAAARGARGARLPRAKAIVADVTSEADTLAMVAAARAAHGPIDILVANAGAAESAPFGRTDLAQWQRMIDVNLTGAFLTVKAALPDLLRKDDRNAGGRIIFIASTAGLKGYAYVAAYCAAKHGVIGLARALAAELAPQGVTVNAVCPGYTDTPMLAASIANIEQKTSRSRAEAESEPQAPEPAGPVHHAAGGCPDRALAVLPRRPVHHGPGHLRFGGRDMRPPMRCDKRAALLPPPGSKALPSTRRGGRAMHPRLSPAIADRPKHSTAGLSRWTHRVGVTAGIRDRHPHLGTPSDLARRSEPASSVAMGELSPSRSVLPPPHDEGNAFVIGGGKAAAEATPSRHARNRKTGMPR